MRTITSHWVEMPRNHPAIATTRASIKSTVVQLIITPFCHSILSNSTVWSERCLPSRFTVEPEQTHPQRPRCLAGCSPQSIAMSSNLVGIEVHGVIALVELIMLLYSVCIGLNYLVESPGPPTGALATNCIQVPTGLTHTVPSSLLLNQRSLVRMALWIHTGCMAMLAGAVVYPGWRSLAIWTWSEYWLSAHYRQRWLYISLNGENVVLNLLAIE